MLLKRWNSLPGNLDRIFDTGYGYHEKNFLVFFRITVCLVAIFDVLSMLADFHLLFSPSKTIIPQELIYLPTEYFTRLQSFFGFIKQHNLEPAFYSGILWVYMGSLLALMLGLFSRGAALIALVSQLLIFRSFGPLNYGYDSFITMSLFYCLIFPVGKYYALSRKLSRTEPKPVQFNYQRVLQFHLCIVYFFSGIAKVIDPNWWNGNSIWRSVASLYSDYYNIPAIIMAITGVGVIILETCYPLLVYHKRTRKITILLVIVMHLSIGIMLKLYSFAAIMIVWNIAAFGKLTTIKSVNENPVESRA